MRFPFWKASLRVFEFDGSVFIEVHITFNDHGTSFAVEDSVPFGLLVILYEDPLIESLNDTV